MIRLFWSLAAVVAVVTVLFAAWSATEETSTAAPGDVVQSAANAFVEGYNNRDFTRFHSFFATAEQGADAAGESNFGSR